MGGPTARVGRGGSLRWPCLKSGLDRAERGAGRAPFTRAYTRPTACRRASGRRGDVCHAPCGNGRSLQRQLLLSPAANLRIEPGLWPRRNATNLFVTALGAAPSQRHLAISSETSSCQRNTARRRLQPECPQAFQDYVDRSHTMRC